MYLDILNSIEFKYYKACYAAYHYDFKNFVANFDSKDLGSFEDIHSNDEDRTPEEVDEDIDCYLYGKPGREDLLTYYMIRGIRFSFYFAWKLRHSDIPLNDYILRAISARFIMSNYLDDDIIKEYIPACLFYPNVPKKETCFKLLEICSDYKYSLGIVASFNIWMDLFEKCDYEYVDIRLWSHLHKYNREKMISILADKSKSGRFICYDGRVRLDVELNDFYPTKSTKWNSIKQFEPIRLLKYRTINEESMDFDDGGNYDALPSDQTDITGIGFVKNRELERLIHLNERMEELYM